MSPTCTTHADRLAGSEHDTQTGRNPATERAAYLSGYLAAFTYATGQPLSTPPASFLPGSMEAAAYRAGRSDGHAEATMRERLDPGRTLSATGPTITTDDPADHTRAPELTPQPAGEIPPDEEHYSAPWSATMDAILDPYHPSDRGVAARAYRDGHREGHRVGWIKAAPYAYNDGYEDGYVKGAAARDAVRDVQEQDDPFLPPEWDMAITVRHHDRHATPWKIAMSDRATPEAWMDNLPPTVRAVMGARFRAYADLIDPQPMPAEPAGPAEPRTTSHETVTLHRIAYLTGRARAIAHGEGLTRLAVALAEIPLPTRGDVQDVYQGGRVDGREEVARRAGGKPPVVGSNRVPEQADQPDPTPLADPPKPPETTLGTDLRGYATQIDIGSGLYKGADRWVGRTLTRIADDLRRYADKADRTTP